MQMEEISSLLVYGLLELFLRGQFCWQVADAAGRDIVLGERVDESFPYL